MPDRSHEATVAVTRGTHRASITVLIRDDESATDAIIRVAAILDAADRAGRKEQGDGEQ